MGTPVIIVASGGLPVIVSTSGYGVPMTVATNGYGIAVTQAATGLPVVGITFGPDVTAPTITSGASVSNAEGALLAHSLHANEPVTWTIVGGADQARFELFGSTLRWLGNGVKDFEAPNDADVNNVYVVQVRATDAVALTANQTINVTVTDVSAGTAPAAPVLDLTTDASDTTPDFTLTGDLVLGDTVRFQYATASDFTGTSELTNAIDAGEDAANAISFSTGALASPATWYFRARIERPDHVNSDWSNTETVTFTGPALDASTTAWVNAVIADGGTVSVTQQTNVNALVVGLKADGVWTILDRLWLFAGESSASQAKIDLKNLAANTKSGTPALFDVGGYKGDASTFYINSGFTPSTSGVNFLLNTASAGFYEQTRITSGIARFGSFGGSQNHVVVRKNSTEHAIALSGGAVDITDSSFASPGCWTLVRPNGTTLNLYRNGSTSPVGGPIASIVGGIENIPFGILARSVGGGTFDSRSPAQLSAVYFGGTLTAAQAVSLNNRINDYMIAWNRNQYNHNIATTQWDPANKTAGISLGTEGMVALNTSGAATEFVRTVGSASTGKKVSEFTRVVAGQCRIGLVNASTNFATMPYLGKDTNSIGYYDAGQVVYNDATVATLNPFTDGDTIAMEVDLDARTVKFAKNGGSLSTSIAIPPAGALYPALQLGTSTSGIIGNFGSAYWLRTPTSGYGIW